MQAVQALINEIIRAAKKAGLSQRDLAGRAGISPENLSRAKKKGEISASTLLAMAEVIDMELSLTPGNTKEKAIEAVKSGTFFKVARRKSGG